MIHVLGQEIAFPDPRRLKVEVETGLIAIGGDFAVERLLAAYRRGIFPWTANPITWWSPNPRGVFEFDRFHVPRSMRPVLKRCRLLSGGEIPRATDDSRFEITRDRAFRQVIERCAT